MTGLRVQIREKRFDQDRILEDLVFEIPAGERVALLGRSGIGKSTLLSLIAGMDGDFDGQITRPVGRISMVFQQPRLLPWRTLVRNITLIPGAEDERRARDLLSAVGLAEAADQHPEKVSLGMQRRAALARAMAVQPALVLMDEPLVSLDPESAAEMRRLLVEMLDRSKASALITTHDRREALMLADRVLTLGGRPARLQDDRRSPLDRRERSDPNSVEAAFREMFGDG